jgi:DnaJ family protein A protein 5
MGRHILKDDRGYLLYFPHCPRALYESVLAANFSPSFGQQPARVLLGNDLIDYMPGFTREEEQPKPTDDDKFEKPKKKRKGKGPGEREVKDGVLYRLGEFSQ